MRTALFVFAVVALIATTSASVFAKRFHNSSLTNEGTTRIPDYSNPVSRFINCSKDASYCSGADNRSTISIPHFFAYNLTTNVDRTGFGTFSGNLEYIYNGTLFNGTQNATAVYGWAMMKFTGKASRFGGENGTIKVVVDNTTTPYISNDNNSFIFNAAQGLFSNVYVYEVQRYVNKYFQNSSNTTNSSTVVISIPNYANSSAKSVNCSSNWWTCSGASNNSAFNTSNAVSQNLTISINNITGAGYLTGYLIVPYSAHLLNSTNTADIQETIDTAFKGTANLTIFGTVDRAGVNGTVRVEVEPSASGNVTLDRSYFASNAVKGLYYNIYSWEIQQYVNTYFSANPLAKTHGSVKGRIVSF